MKIIALHGKGGCGKTTVLRYLYHLLTGDFNYSQFYFYRENKEKINDISAMFEFNGKKLGLTTLGDSEKDLKRPFEVFQKENCNLVVCAVRSRDTKNGANSFLKAQSKEITWIKKAYIDTYHAKCDLNETYKELNMLQAKVLKEEMEKQI